MCICNHNSNPTDVNVKGCKGTGNCKFNNCTCFRIVSVFEKVILIANGTVTVNCNYNLYTCKLS